MKEVGDMEKTEILEGLSTLFSKIEDKRPVYKYCLNEVLSQNDRKKLDKVYLNNLECQKKILNNKITIEKIENLISYVSYSYKNEENLFLEDIFEKNLKIFTKLKTFILIYSKETEEIFNLLQSKYNGKIEVKGILIEEFTTNYIHDKMENMLEKLKVNSLNSIIDVTLGMKAVTIALYKLSVEKNIIGINWQEKQIPIYKLENNKYVKTNSQKRFPFNSKIEIMIEPKKENIKIYEYINRSIQTMNFLATESYYNQLNNKGMEFFYSKLAKLFSFENMISLDEELFYEEVECFFESLSKIKELTRDNLLKIREFLKELLCLILFEENEDSVEIRNFYWLDSFLQKFQIKKDELWENDFIFEDYKMKVYYYFIMEYFNSKKVNENVYYYNKFMKNLTKNMMKELNLKTEDEISKIFIKMKEKIRKLDPKVILLESINGEFYYENKVIYIEKYGLKIDTEDKRISFINNKGADIIRELLQNYMTPIKEKALFHKLIKYRDAEPEEIRKNRFRKNLSILRNKVKDFNNNLKEIARENDKNIGDIIIYKKFEGEKSDFSHEFRVNPEFYTLV